jgi:hypothetical protein
VRNFRASYHYITFYFLLDVVHMRTHSDSEKIDLVNKEEWWASLVPERLDGFYSYSAFLSISVIGRCQVNVNIPALQIGAIHMGPKTQNGDFLKDDSNNAKETSVIYGDHRPTQHCTGGIFRKITVRALGVPNTEVQCVKTGFTGRTNVPVRRHSTTKSLTNNNLFRSQGNLIMSIV